MRREREAAEGNSIRKARLYADKAALKGIFILYVDTTHFRTPLLSPGKRMRRSEFLNVYQKFMVYFLNKICTLFRIRPINFVFNIWVIIF